MQVQITVPDGLVYEPGTARGPGADPLYDTSTRTLTWHGEANAGERVEISFRAAAQLGYPPGIATLHSQVTGIHSGQEWHLATGVWLNRYGLLLPVIRR